MSQTTSTSSSGSSTSIQAAGAEAAPKEDSNIIIVSDVEQSMSAVDHVLTSIKPSAMAVCCYGENLGTESGKIRLLVLVMKEKSYIYDIRCNNEDLIEDGRVKELFCHPNINKVYKFIKQEAGKC